MTGVDTRSVSRDSLFLLANVLTEREGEPHRVRVRNLSDGGMMGEGNLRVQRGERIEIELRNIGRIAGSVAWVQDNRFGVAFDNPIESHRARAPVAEGKSEVPGMIDPSWAHRAPPPPKPTNLRKV